MPAGPEFLAEIGDDAASDLTIYDAEGCRECAGTGYRGRRGIYELLEVSDSVRNLILQRAPADRIKGAAVEEGMRTLRVDGWHKVKEGATTVPEVLRVTQDEF